MTTIVDRPEEIRRWFQIVDECTDDAGLVTSEMVPALHAVAPERRIGGRRAGAASLLSRARHSLHRCRRCAIARSGRW